MRLAIQEEINEGAVEAIHPSLAPVLCFEIEGVAPVANDRNAVCEFQHLHCNQSNTFALTLHA